MSPARPAVLRAAAAALLALSALAGPAAAARPAGVVAEAPSTVFDLAPGSGRLVTLPSPATSLFVGDPGVADAQPVSARLVYIMGSKPGDTDLFAVDDAERVIASFRLRVRADAAATNDAAAPLTSKGAVRAEYARDHAIVRGHVVDVGAALDAAALSADLGTKDRPGLDRTTFAAPTQVNLRVRFVEVSRDNLFRLGVNWGALANVGSFSFGLATGRLNFNPRFRPPPAGTESFGTVGVGARYDGTDINALIDALDREGLVDILAEPTLTTVTGKPARFLAGGEFPIPVPQANQVVTVEFRSFGVSLDFTPTLLPDQRIALDVMPEVSTLDPTQTVTVSNSFAVPGLTVRRAQTTVELASGETFAIAGLFQRDQRRSLEGLPGIRNTPVLGKLFESQRFQKQETELMILITPYLVGDRAQPGAAAAAVPGTDRAQPGAAAAAVPGTDRAQPGAAAAAVPGTDRLVGFIVR